MTSRKTRIRTNLSRRSGRGMMMITTLKSNLPRIRTHGLLTINPQGYTTFVPKVYYYGTNWEKNLTMPKELYVFRFCKKIICCVYSLRLGNFGIYRNDFRITSIYFLWGTKVKFLLYGAHGFSFIILSMWDSVVYSRSCTIFLLKQYLWSPYHSTMKLQ